jgi:hypothetical protein
LGLSSYENYFKYGIIYLFFRWSCVVLIFLMKRKRPLFDGYVTIANHRKPNIQRAMIGKSWKRSHHIQHLKNGQQTCHSNVLLILHSASYSFQRVKMIKILAEKLTIFCQKFSWEGQNCSKFISCKITKNFPGSLAPLLSLTPTMNSTLTTLQVHWRNWGRSGVTLLSTPELLCDMFKYCLNINIIFNCYSGQSLHENVKIWQLFGSKSILTMNCLSWPFLL